MIAAFAGVGEGVSCLLASYLKLQALVTKRPLSSFGFARQDPGVLTQLPVLKDGTKGTQDSR